MQKWAIVYKRNGKKHLYAYCLSKCEVKYVFLRLKGILPKIAIQFVPNNYLNMD